MMSQYSFIVLFNSRFGGLNKYVLVPYSDYF